MLWWWLLSVFLYKGVDGFSPSLWGWGMPENNNFSFAYIYGPNEPTSRTTTVQLPSACNNVGADDYAYFCPHMLMFSTDMLLAPWYDRLEQNFHYAVAGGNAESQCGECYQVKLTKANYWKSTLSEKQLVIQIDNFGYDVDYGQFDISMGAGGFGTFTALNSDCKSRYCTGGPCGNPMYNGKWDSWTEKDDCNSGGLNIAPDKSDATIWEECKKLTGGSYGYKDQALWQSCYFSRVFYYHQNFYGYESLRVKCPLGLTMLTGLRRTDDQHLPSVSIKNVLNTICKDRTCITTTHDGCRTACAYEDKVPTDNTQWRKIDTCTWDGLLL